MPLHRQSILTVLIAGAALAVAPASACAARPLWLGFDEPTLISAPDSTDPANNAALVITNRVKATGSRFQRVALSWREIAPKRPRNPKAWNDPAYRWGYADAALRAVADERPTIGSGLEPILTIESAPDWAQVSKRPRTAELNRYPGAWKPDVNAVRDFAYALASRYAGGRKNIRGRLLPRVRRFQFWNEPNLSTHLSPQYDARRKPFAPLWYGRMLKAFREGARAGGGSSVFVIGAGMAPFGNVSGASAGISPQLFARTVLCLARSRRGLVALAGCMPTAFDAWAQHPYDIAGSPFRGADPDHQRGVVADLPSIRTALDRAVALKTVVPALRKPLWVTEFDWWTKPPAKSFGSTPEGAANWTVESLWRMWAAGVDVVVWYRLRDHQAWPGGLWFSGSSLKPSLLTPDLLDADTPKPGLQRFIWPMRITGGAKPYAWGVVPCRRAGVAVTVQRAAGTGWATQGSGKTSSSGVFQVMLRSRPRATWRVMAPEGCGGASPTWRT